MPDAREEEFFVGYLALPAKTKRFVLAVAVACFALSLPWSHALCASLANLVLSIAFAFAWRAFKQRLPAFRERAQQRLSMVLGLPTVESSSNA